MKNICITFFLFVIIIATVVFATTYPVSAPKAENEYLRIHVRANSNSQIDQAVKYKVKDEVVALISERITECTDKAAAERVIASLIPEIEEVSDMVLRANGFDYGARASVRAEEFPTRVYGEYTLEAGLYDALIVELGSGTGDNWWCVIYPPLCFTSANQDVEYRSIIYDIIEKFFK